MQEEEGRAEKNSPSLMKRNLIRKERLTKSSDIDRVFSGRQSVSCFGAKLFYSVNTLTCNRIVCIAARGFKRAVDRNKVRRHVKEVYRNEKHLLRTGYDLVIIVYPVVKYDYSERKEQILSLFQKAGLYREKQGK